jgi:hypothetical protein
MVAVEARSGLDRWVRNEIDFLVRTTDPRGFSSWPEAIVASLKGGIHADGSSPVGGWRIKDGPYNLRITGVPAFHDLVSGPAELRPLHGHYLPGGATPG